MSYRINILKKRKARKSYGCLWCREKINKGEEYYYRMWKGASYHYHISCVMDSVKVGLLSELMQKEG